MTCKDSCKREVGRWSTTWMFGKLDVHGREKNKTERFLLGIRVSGRSSPLRQWLQSLSFGYEIAGICALLSNKKSKMFSSAGLLHSLLIMGWPTGREVLPWVQQLKHIAGMISLNERGLTWKEGPRGHREWTSELWVIKLQWNSDTPYLHPGALKGLLCTWGA